MATITTAAPVARKPIYSSLFVQVLAALLLGIALGMAVPDFAIGLKIFSDAFLKLISMIVAPIVFCVVVHGIAGAGDLKKVGRVGVKALIYFEVMTTIALVVGLLLAALYKPVWTSAIERPADFALGVTAFLLLAMWRVPPWLVVVLAAVAGQLIG